ncbi:hypothetical protein [uncultured Roseobacter sp.]|uniref:hypothetical protein n=1 Tax=uncultured Roseobacter sp. TaxID=114847 RepID=UPI002609529E|nr:hypothetical protein [uncultured Roseobacter sp.]
MSLLAPMQHQTPRMPDGWPQSTKTAFQQQQFILSECEYGRFLGFSSVLSIRGAIAIFRVLKSKLFLLCFGVGALAAMLSDWGCGAYY